jgi:uncharacterized protein (DUF302 family)
MLKLYQLQECPHCEKVRKALAKEGLPYQVIEVPRLGSLRTEVLGLDGTDSAEVPVLVDDENVIHGSDEIIEYIDGGRGSWYGDPKYGLTKKLEGQTFGDVVPAVKEALAAQGFGVLTEIDVKATMKKKLDADFRNYVILGACNPPLAHHALTEEPAIGLLLPCNVVVTEDDDGTAVVSAIDPRKMVSVLGRTDMGNFADQVRKKLADALTSL